MSNTSLNNKKDPIVAEVSNLNKASPTFLYTFDTGVLIGSGDTGAWRAVTPADLGADIGKINITGVETLILEVDDLEQLAQSGNQYLQSISGDTKQLVNGGTFIPNFQVITNTQIQIPTGVRSYSIAIESGSAYVNGILMNSQMVINGGGYEGRWFLGQEINVGTSGGRVLVNFET
jgi:hypothetical protein